jgi:23S rRNA pseudouridine2457 synthase
MKNELKYFILYKPFGVLCQFSGGENRKTLAAFGPFPKDVYSVGRLDTDSEGLIILTNDGALQHHLIEPKYGHPRTYLVQVENIPSQEALEPLRHGVLIEHRKTLPSEVTLLTEEPILPPRPVPIRYRKNIPTAWIELKISEGRNRQVRKMTAAVGHPTLRLIRISIGPITLNGLQPGESRELRQEELRELFKFVGIKKPASR